MNSDSNTSNKKVMTAREVAAYLKLPMTTLYELVGKGKLHAVKCGRQWRFFESDVINYLHGTYRPHLPISPSEKRSHARIKSALRARMKGLLPETEKEILKGSIRDISEGGVFFVSDGPNGSSKLIKEHPVEIVFELDEPQPVQLQVKGRIVHETRNGSRGSALTPMREHNPSGTGGSCTGFGIKFRLLSESEKEVIKDYVG